MSFTCMTIDHTLRLQHETRPKNESQQSGSDTHPVDRDTDNVDYVCPRHAHLT